MKSNGPRTLPCCTSETTSAHWDSSPFNYYFYLLSLRKCSIHVKVVPEIPGNSSCNMNSN